MKLLTINTDTPKVVFSKTPTRTRRSWVETRQNCLVSSRRRCEQAIIVCRLSSKTL